MVKLNRVVDSDDEFPELSTMIAEGTSSWQKQRASLHEPSSNTNPSEYRASSMHGDGKDDWKKQRPLKIAHVNSMLLSLANRGALSTGARRYVDNRSEQASVRSSIDSPIDVEDLSDHMSDFIVDDSDSGDSEERSHGPNRRFVPLRTQVSPRQTGVDSPPKQSSGAPQETRLLNKPRNPRRDRRLREGEPAGPGAAWESDTHKGQGHSKSVVDNNEDHVEEPSSILK
ncbi:MAG: hypothetical protein Q9168_000235, partial [Polycauliona sp. 1 TL-2023]